MITINNNTTSNNLNLYTIYIVLRRYTVKSSTTNSGPPLLVRKTPQENILCSKKWKKPWAHQVKNDSQPKCSVKCNFKYLFSHWLRTMFFFFNHIDSSCFCILRCCCPFCLQVRGKADLLVRSTAQGEKLFSCLAVLAPIIPSGRYFGEWGSC